MAFDAQTQLANIVVVANETMHLVEVFRTWSEVDWQRPAYCPNWQVCDAVAHLATGGDFYAQVVAAGRTGEPRPPWDVSDVVGFRAARAEAGKKLLDAGPTALIDGFEQGAEKLQQVLSLLKQEDFAQTAWHPRGLVPIGCWIGMRLNELVIHDWDMRQPHEVNASLSITALPAMLTVIPEIQLQFLEQRGGDSLNGVHVLRADTTSWVFTINGKAVIYQEQVPTVFDTRLETDAESLILLTMGRADFEDKLQRGTLTIEGDVEQGRYLGETLFRAF
ncbi:MAG: maleylpyruvate isomerase family mycothiol-dependent enzyme [bacterium]|nr:maleylpyruvate isomerase family mycothiol-dependent enzyme [bacterium]